MSKMMNTPPGLDFSIWVFYDREQKLEFDRTAIIAAQLQQPAADRPPCRSTTPASRKPEPPRRSQSPPLRRSPPDPAPPTTVPNLRAAVVASITGIVLAVELQHRHAKRWTSPNAVISPSPESSAAVALSTAAILSVERNAAVSPSSVVRRRRLQRRQSLLIAVELALRHCRRRASPSPHPAAAPS
ncbi:hypothetical protein DM860_000012 [Cuscuta australis]|uniref:Uncharacterized protein n=1 Tax=Cuscuta australis TaxID=267555 RepID=A0A328CY02_9ASTE|nr:hypothetical protein DM860_000012 [Cuscuta australis]